MSDPPDADAGELLERVASALSDDLERISSSESASTGDVPRSVEDNIAVVVRVRDIVHISIPWDENIPRRCDQRCNAR